MRTRQNLVARAIFLTLPIAALMASLGIANPLFPNQVYVINRYLSTILVADFNRDGIQDFAVAGSQSDTPFPPTGWVEVYLGTSDGSFTATWGASDWRSPAALGLGDFNGDGIPDMVVADSDTVQVTVLLGNGDGSFVLGSYIYAHLFPQSVTVADFDRDGSLDFAVSNWGSNDVAVFLGLGNGMFRTLVSYSVGFAPRSIASADFNSDGRVDLATANQGSGDVSILLGKGDGTFAPETRFPAGPSPVSLKVGDFNGDFVQDLVALDFYLGEVEVFLGHGDGTFGHALVFAAGGEGASSVALGDFNRDGNEDLAVGNIYSETASILLGNGQGEFVATSPVDTDGAWDLAIGDFDRDGRQDLIVVAGEGLLDAPDRVLVLPGKGDGSFGPDVPFTPGDGFFDIVSQDFDADGNADLAGIRYGDPVGSAGSLSILLGVGDGTFHVEPSISLATRPISIVSGDFNRDGHPDLVVVNAGLASAGIEGDVWILLGDGNGGFGIQQKLKAGHVPSSVVVGDFDSDGDQDLVVANAGGEPSVDVPGGLSLFPGNGDGTFAQAVGLGAILHPRLLVVGYLNADRKLDLAVAGTDPITPATVFILLGKGDGTFQRIAQLTPPDGLPKAIVVGDFNADGGMDLFLVGSSSVCVSRSIVGQMTLFAGRGDGSFGGPATSWGVGGCPARMTVGDFNADRIDDLVVMNGASGDASLLLGSAGTGLLPEVRLRVGGAPGAVAANDFDGDTRLDLALGHFGGLSVLLNQGPFPDADEDGIPDATDSCTDTDGDGFGNPGLRANTCPPDNCPNTSNTSQADADGDGQGDTCDLCTDTDRDGFGDPGLQLNVCRADNCRNVPNPGQENSDADGFGDACDPCPHDPLNDDADGDGICEDNDNCPALSNPDQDDSNHDGSGDACQPTLTFYGSRNLGDDLEIVLSATDPQNDPLSGLVEVMTLPGASITLPDGLASGDCSQGYLPAGVIGEGIGFTNGAVGAPYLFDLDSNVFCNDRVPDYLLALGRCEDYQAIFSSVLPLADVVPPAALCLRRPNETAGGLDLTILTFDLSVLILFRSEPDVVLRFPFDHGLPEPLDITSLVLGQTYRLQMTVTDGATVPVTAQETFVYQGELRMVFKGLNSPPHAIISSAPTAECTGPTGGVVTIDASGSTDPDSSTGTNDDIVSFEWFENPGQPAAITLGSGRVLNTTLSLGTHLIGLVVADSKGAMDATQTIVTVADTTPPALACPTVAETECTGSQGASVSMAATATDVCSPTVQIQNSRTPHGADASGVYSLGTTPVTFTAADASGNVATCSAPVTVRDTTAPSLTLAAVQAVLWPPNHRLVPVHISWQANDRCDPSPAVILVSALSSEPDDASGAGDGNTVGDTQDASIGTPDTTVLLRAERSGGGPGRVYTLTYAARDASGNATSSFGIVTVPLDEGTGPEPVMMYLEGNGTPGMAHLYWNTVPGADVYDVIQGNLSHVSESNGKTSLGPVHVLASGQYGASYSEGPSGAIPTVGSAFFFLVQYRKGQNPSGWGTESSPWPAEPSSCDIACP